MAKKKEPDWVTAKMLFEIGKPLSMIESETGINKGSISRKAKKEKWQQGVATAEIQKASEVELFKATLSNSQLHIFNDEVAAKVLFENELKDFTHIAIQKNKELMLQCKDGQESKAIIDGMDKLSVTVGYNQRHANAQVINNNAQAAVVTEPKKLSDFYDNA